MRFGILDALFEDLLRLLDKLTVQIDRVGRNSSIGVVLPEDKLGSLLIILLHLATVGLALLGQLLGAGAIAARVGILGLNGVSEVQFPCRCKCDCNERHFGVAYPSKTLSALGGFLAGEVAEPIVLRLGVAAILVVEGCGKVSACESLNIAIITPRAHVGHFVRHGCSIALNVIREEGESPKVGTQKARKIRNPDRSTFPWYAPLLPTAFITALRNALMSRFTSLPTLQDSCVPARNRLSLYV